MLDRKRHPFYRHSDAAFFLALDAAGAAVGRVAVLDNRNYNAYNHEQTAFFYLFECEDDPATAQSLFDAAFAWARARGLDRVYGPKGFTALDGMGLLVQGFEHRPAFGIPYNLPTYPGLLESAGFEAGKRCPLRAIFPATSSSRRRFIASPNWCRSGAGCAWPASGVAGTVRALIPDLQAMYNDAMEGTTGNVPLTDDEVRTMAAQLLWFADPRLIKLVMARNAESGKEHPVGFLFAYPDISAAMQRHKGRLFPFGWIDMLLELRRTEWVNINGAGIVEEYRGLGGTALLFSELYKGIVERGARARRCRADRRGQRPDAARVARLRRRLLQNAPDVPAYLRLRAPAS